VTISLTEKNTKDVTQFAQSSIDKVLQQGLDLFSPSRISIDTVNTSQQEKPLRVLPTHIICVHKS
jgi:hypothetical protein